MKNLKIRILFFLVIVFIIHCIFILTAEAVREIPDDNLSYSIQVKVDGKSIGSAFYLSTNDFFYLVTAKHIFYNIETGNLRGEIATLLSYAKDPDDKTRNILRLDLKMLDNQNKIKKQTKRDIAIIKIGTWEVKEEIRFIRIKNGITIIKKSISGLACVISSNVTIFTDVLVGNEVYIFGYPSSLGIKKIPQIDYERPLLRKGIVAGLNVKSKSIILDCPVYGGNSGGPVLQVENVGIGGREFRLIGIVTQFVPYAKEWLNKRGYTNKSISNSGYSVAEPVDVILELIESLE